ncbi:DUF4880 domain-containing protein [Marinomonas shanghaiensis]|uniref:DUF4880 domain-containing protein n=1 Tax=Marinomonas shanghaiensis TaxID=2202418 RepID=UPI003A8CCB3C
MTSSQSVTYAHLEAASEWFAVLSDTPVSDIDKAAWQQWLSEDERHRKAWQQVESVSVMFSSFQDNTSQQSAGYVLERTHAVGRRQLLKGVLGLAGMASLGWLSWEKTALPSMVAAWRTDFHTSVGEVSSFSLDDGSNVWLNTNSAMAPYYTAAVRHLSLVSGETFVDLDNQDSRPFTLSCEQAIVRPRTRNVRFCLRYLPNQQAILAVYKGAVSVALNDSATKSVNAGESVTFNTESFGDVVPALALYESWIKGLLVVEDMPLSDFVNELNRYRNGYINVDPAVADWRVVGTYPIHNIDVIFGMLESTFPLRVQKTLPWWVSVSAA